MTNNLASRSISISAGNHKKKKNPCLNHPPVHSARLVEESQWLQSPCAPPDDAFFSSCQLVTTAAEGRQQEVEEISSAHQKCAPRVHCSLTSSQVPATRRFASST